MTTSTLNWAGAAQLLDGAKSILVVTHVRPDGDAIGSLLSVRNALNERGKKVDAAVDGGVPDFADFLPGADAVLAQLESGEWDLLICVDISDEERSGAVGAYGKTHSRAAINIDHHPTNPLFGDAVLVDAEAVSTTEIIYRWLAYLQHRITLEVATPLLAGLVTDTMGFHTNNVRPSTLEIAQRLMEVGASLYDIMARMMDSTPYSVVKLWREVFPSVALEEQVISASITQVNIQAAGVSEKTPSNLVSMLITVNEARIAVVFKEQPSGKIELSMRCKPGWDVVQVALTLGGGGHKLAAGATIDGPLESAKARVLPLLQEAARQGSLTLA